MAEGVCVERGLLRDNEGPGQMNPLVLGLKGGQECGAGLGGFLMFQEKMCLEEEGGGEKCSGAEDLESLCSEEDNCRKKRCADRYDSSESSDSGVAVHCGDCGSSNSDITEPCSPLSTTSLEEMPPTQSQHTWPWTEGDSPSSKRAKQGKITEYFKTKTRKGLEKQHKLISKFLVSSVDTKVGYVDKVEFSSTVASIPKFFESDDLTKSESSDHSDEIDIDTEKGSSIASPSLPDSPSPLETLECDSEILHKICEAGDVSTDSGVSSESLSRSSISSGSLSSSPTPSSQQDSGCDRDHKEEEEERTIRFPAKSGWKGHYISDVLCRWTDCEDKFTTTTALIEHLQIKHVNTQTECNQYMCRWADCKVYERTSCSRNWLERHVLSHGGNKPFRCIVDDCGQRFSSQTLLQRHVNNHFSEGNQSNAAKKNCELSNKLIRRNGKKLRYRRHPFSARIYDYFDSGIMEGLQHNLIEVTEKRTQGLFDEIPGDSVVLQSKIMAKRTDMNGESKILLRWYPPNVLCDEWVDEGSTERTRHVKMTHLSSQSKDCLASYLHSHQRVMKRTSGRKYKPPTSEDATT